LSSLLLCIVAADANLPADVPSGQCVANSAKRRIGMVQKEINEAVQSLKKVVKEMMDIPRVLMSERKESKWYARTKKWTFHECS
ncbi:hypothetical protein PFISCL1PPCAC_27268, partial [Pristionchus fissidentatus]